MEYKNIQSDFKEKSKSEWLLDEEIKMRHQEDLGLDIPEEYFSISKKNILNKTVFNTKKRKTVKTMNLYIGGIAAVFLLALLIKGVFNDSLSSKYLNSNEENILISSLFIDDENIECLSDAYMLGDLYDDDLCIN